METTDNTSETVTLSQVEPDANDKIVLSFQRLSGNGHINALVITKYPSAIKSADKIIFCYDFIQVRIDVFLNSFNESPIIVIHIFIHS